MKKIFKLIIPALSALLILGCTKTMEDMNESDLAMTEESTDVGDYACRGYLTTMLSYVKNINGSWQYQVQQTLNADLFAGYFMHPGNFGAVATNDNYVFNGIKWNGQAFTDAQTVLSNFVALKKVAGASFTDYVAYGTVLKVLAASAVVDGFGPYPYLKYGQENAPWDNVDDIYLKGFLPELDAAIDTMVMYSQIADLKDRIKKGESDISTLKGNINNWIKLANTLRLRYAMRVSKVEPAIAEQYVKKCQDSQLGYLTTDFAIDIKENKLSNPFFFQSKEWDDLVMGADIYSFLTGYNDSRVKLFFNTSKGDTALHAGLAHNYAAMRQGCPMIKESDYIKFSQVNYETFNKFVLVSGAEASFLLAEAALNGWVTDKSAGAYYTEGVTNSFKLFGATIGEYLNSNSKPADYIDIVNSENNFSATTTITPKWDDAATQAEKLERIITQKWIAIFPNGAEAWAEFRRTGYPKIKLPKFMETGPNEDGTIPQGEFVKRLPYPTPVKNASKTINEAITKYLNGKDDGNQRLWWDVD